MKLERRPSTDVTPAHVNIFSKKANLKIPDSPPPEEEKVESPKPGQKSKFEELMQAACHIKQNEMENRRRKFELLPSFLKAGVYYSTKLEGVRHQSISYYQRLFAFQLIMRGAEHEFLNKNFDSACRKYEEVSKSSVNDIFGQAYSIWRYFNSINPNWSTEGLDDTQIEEVDWQGQTDFERQ